MAGRIFLVNVGANASHRFCSPLFSDGTFEFIPIPEDGQPRGQSIVSYCDLASFNRPGQSLIKYVPQRLWYRPAHNDPEFETFTFGDNCERSPRAASLKSIAVGDFLFFLARLESWKDGKRTKKYGFYFIGYIEISEIARSVWSPMQGNLAERFKSNAHVRRGHGSEAIWDGFWVFGGSRRSVRFHKAVPLTRDFAEKVLIRADGLAWRWNENRTDLQVIGSYTRSCRCVINPNITEDVARFADLWKWVEIHSS